MTKPEKTFRQGSCSASIFVNELNKDGRKMQMKSVVLQRSYKAGDEWKNTNSYTANDLPKLVLAATKAFDYLTSKEEAA